MFSFPQYYLKCSPVSSCDGNTETRAGFKSKLANFNVIGEDVTLRYFWGSHRYGDIFSEISCGPKHNYLCPLPVNLDLQVYIVSSHL